MTDQNKRLDGRVAIISGAAQGMGASHARGLAAAGAKVVISDISDKKGEALVKEIGHDKSIFVHLDVTDYSSWKEAVDRTKSEFGRIDILVNNAGIFTRGSVEDTSIEDWKKTIDIDLTGNFLGIKAVVPEMRVIGGGSIINISSIAGLVGFKNRVAYSTAKWGIQGLTKTSALDLGPDNIRVNSIHPGSVNTPMTEHLQRGFGQIPLGRDANVKEITDLVIFLASNESSFITGSAFAIDGGETAGNNLRKDS